MGGLEKRDDDDDEDEIVELKLKLKYLEKTNLSLSKRDAIVFWGNLRHGIIKKLLGLKEAKIATYVDMFRVHHL